jgi:hypothetical protein
MSTMEPAPQRRRQHDLERRTQQEVAARHERERLAARAQVVAREREAAVEAARAQAAERERQSVQADIAYLEERFAAYCTRRHDLPPALLPLEEAGELHEFVRKVEQHTLRVIRKEAISTFIERTEHRARQARMAMSALEAAIRRKGLLPISAVARLMRRCKVSIVPPETDSPAREAIERSQRLVRAAWTDSLARGSQAVFTAHRSGGRTIVHVGSGAHGSVFITVDAELNPEDLAREFLQQVAGGAERFFSGDGVIATVDGAHQSFNPKRVFKRAIAVRSVTDDVDRIRRNVDALMRWEAPVPATSSLHLGAPANERELAAVFRDELPDWSVWDGVQRDWQERAQRHGFAVDATPATREAVLRALAAEKNVIVVLAHADGERVFLPSPPPEGSQVTTHDIRAHAEAIRANGPLVYLFCCEAADISNTANFAQALVESGARGVIAPQTEIDARLSADLFEKVVAGGTAPADAMNRLRAAEAQTGYREMEIWVA